MADDCDTHGNTNSESYLNNDERHCDDVDDHAGHVEHNKNWKFYMNEIESEPDGAKIEKMLRDWSGDYKKLEDHHGYIQWLFPINERGVNNFSQELKPCEAKAIKQSDIACKRFIRAYKMMLDFYGLRLVDLQTGNVEKSAMWFNRFAHLNRSYHNYLRITRIIRCMGELGFTHLQAPLVNLLVSEAFVKRTLDRACESCLMYWIPAVADENERARLLNLVREARESRRTTRSLDL